MRHEPSLIRELFHLYFQVVPATTEDLKRVAFKMRHDVYCKELGYEDIDRFPNGYEIDEYDDYSYHCLLLYKPKNQFAGCVRLVRVPTTTPRRPLPFEQVCEGTIDKKIIDLNTLNPNSYGEISRLAVIANFRRRAGELEVPYPLVQEGLPELGNAENERRSFPHIALGLYLSAAAIGLNLGMERAFAMMESRLARRLHIYGIHFEQIGTEVEHRGKRAPFQITKAKLYAHLNNDIRGLLDDIQKSVDAFP